MANIVAPQAEAPIRRRLTSEAKAGSDVAPRVAGGKRTKESEPAKPEVEESAPAKKIRGEVDDVAETLDVSDTIVVEPAETEPSEAAAGKKKRRRKTSARESDTIPDEVLPESPGESAPADKLDDTQVHALASDVVPPAHDKVAVYDEYGFRRSRSEEKDKYRWNDPGRTLVKDLKRWFEVTNCGRIPDKAI